jgi:hypothetical protein
MRPIVSPYPKPNYKMIYTLMLLVYAMAVGTISLALIRAQVIRSNYNTFLGTLF